MHDYILTSIMATMCKLLFCLAVYSTVFTVTYGLWSSIPGRLKHITGTVNYMWGVDEFDRIYKCPEPCRGRWVLVPGHLMQLDASDEEVWGVNRANQIFKRPVDGSGIWRRIPGTLKHVSPSGNGYVWGVNARAQIFKCKKPCNGRWILVNGHLAQVDGGHDYVYGVNAIRQVFRRPVDGGQDWSLIPNRLLDHVTGSGRDEVWGTTRGSYVYRCKKPCIGNWERMEGRLKQCDATFNGLVCVDPTRAIFSRYTGI